MITENGAIINVSVYFVCFHVTAFYLGDSRSFGKHCTDETNTQGVTLASDETVTKHTQGFNFSSLHHELNWFY